MPLYEYLCDACGHRFEVIRKFSDEPLETCPKCGGSVHKLASAPAFHLKGTGWYVTDYAKKDSGAGGKSDGSKEDSATTGGEGTPAKGDAAGKSDGKSDKTTAGSDASSSSGASSTSSSTSSSSPSSSSGSSTTPSSSSSAKNKESSAKNKE